jgi:membrane protein
MIVILVGAQLNAETEQQTERDSSVSSTEPLGERGATNAHAIGFRT